MLDRRTRELQQSGCSSYNRIWTLRTVLSFRKLNSELTCVNSRHSIREEQKQQEEE